MAQSDATQIFPSDNDNFGGVIIKPRHYGQVPADEFRVRLIASIAACKEGGKRGVWLTIPLSQSELIPVAAELDFEFHHAKSDHVTMTRWLPQDEASTLPIYATHNIGVGGFVVNDKNEVLLVQEKYLRGLRVPHWKLPGGVCDPGEDIWKTAVRETLEETGIKTEFVSVLCFRQMHGYTWGTDDLYFACLLRPLSSDIHVSPSEIAAAKWMDIDEYIADPNTFPSNAFIAESYKKAVKSGVMIQPTVFPHFLSSKPNLSMYQITPCDPTQPCDMTAKDWDRGWQHLVAPAASTDKPKANI